MAYPIVAIVGRPNVGKSTLFNKLTGSRLSIVDDTPGVTRDRIFGECEWLGHTFLLVDTGGIEPFSDDVILSQMRRQAELAIDSADVIILVTDIRSGVVATDAEVASMLQKSGKPIVLCVNKCDAVGETPAEFYEFYNLGGKIYLKFSYSTSPVYTTDTTTQYQNATSARERADYSTSKRYDRTFPIDEIEQTVTVSSSDQLYFAIKKGYRPVPVSGSNAYYLYNRMRAILSYINQDSFSDAKKVHMIYDYIVDTVIYDYDFTENVIQQVTGSDLFLYKCLYMEGVFGLTNKKTFDTAQCVAICDGLSKAFLCMARIEGINAIKVSGIAMTAYGQERGAHAWNKVEVSGKWYMVDTTWGNQLSSSSSASTNRRWMFPFYSGDTTGSTSGKQNEYLSHDYCMVADDNKHDEDPWYAYPVANTAQPRLS